MDRRTLLAVVLSVGIYYAWLTLRGPQLNAEGEEAPTDGETPAQTEPVPVPEVPVPIAPPEPAPDAVEDQEVPFNVCGATATLHTAGGLSSLTLDDHLGPYDVQPLYIWIWGKITGSVEGGWSPWGSAEPGPAEVLSDIGRALSVGTGPGPAAAAPAGLAVVESSDTSVTLRGRSADGIQITQVLRQGFHEASQQCVLDVDVTWHNPRPTAYDGDLWVGIHDAAGGGGSGMTARYTSNRQPTAVADETLHYGGVLGAGCVRDGTQLSDEDRAFPLEGAVSWFGISDRYFGFYTIPENPDAGQVFLSRVGTGEEALDGVHLAIPGGLAASATRTERFTTYIGSNDMDVLAAVHPDLKRVVDLGWFAFFGYPLLWLLRLFYSGVGNWGWSIVLLTLAVKLLFFPMTQKSFKSMQKMQKIQPELNKIREEMADRPQEMNQKVWATMQEHKVNPAAGCLPMLVQMPVWIALYNVLLTSVDLYHTEFLYLRDLTQPDPYLVLPVTIMVLMFVQQRFNTPATMDPAQQQVMKFMPLFFGLLFFAFPSGLAVYVFMNMVLSNIQQWLIKRGLDNDDGPAPDSPDLAAATS